MSLLGFLCIALGLLLAGAVCLFLLKRRDLRALEALSDQLSGIGGDPSAEQRVAVQSDLPRVTNAAAAVNRLLSRLDSRDQKLQEREILFQRLVEAVHEAVVLHRESILYANSRFAALTGLSPKDLIGRKLHEPPWIPNFGVPGRGPRLLPGMVFAIEPMVNMGRPAVKVLADGWTAVTRDGSLSAHFEHTVAVTKNGPDVLTLRPSTVGTN